MGGYYREVLTAADWRQINMQLPFQSVSDKQTPLAPRCFACVERPVPLALVVTTHLASPCLVLFGEGVFLRSRACAGLLFALLLLLTFISLVLPKQRESCHPVAVRGVPARQFLCTLVKKSKEKPQGACACEQCVHTSSKKQGWGAIQHTYCGEFGYCNSKHGAP